VSAETGICPLRRRAAWLVADHPGSPALLESSLNMQRTRDDVHSASPDVRREHDGVSQSPMPIFYDR
jgi:hypothetical protein